MMISDGVKSAYPVDRGTDDLPGTGQEFHSIDAPLGGVGLTVHGRVQLRRCGRSDDTREFGEGRREAVLWVGIDAEFVVAAA